MGQVKIVHPEVPLPRFVGFKEMENDENWCIAGSWFQTFFIVHNIWDVILPN